MHGAYQSGHVLKRKTIILYKQPAFPDPSLLPLNKPSICIRQQSMPKAFPK